MDLENTAIVGCVRGDAIRNLKISDSIITVNSVNQSECHLLVLVDTGSVSFIQNSVYKIFFDQNSLYCNEDANSYRTLNGSTIPIIL